MPFAALCLAAGFGLAVVAPAGAGAGRPDPERAAWEAFVKSLNTATLAKDFPGPLRDLDSGDDRNVIRAANVLGTSGAIEAIPFLVPLLEARSVEVRVQAGLNLERIVSSVELKRRDLAQPDRVRLRPRTTGDPDLTPLRWVVRRMMQAADDGNTAAYAATMAAYIGLRDLAPELRRLLQSRHPAVTQSARHALQTLGCAGEPEAHPPRTGVAAPDAPAATPASRPSERERFSLKRR